MADRDRAVIDRFSGDFGFLSNFHPSTIFFEGEKYKTVEHAYQASKTLDPQSKKLIRETRRPGDAKKLGRAVVLRPDWESVKVSVMKDLVRRKFANPFLGPMLLATEDALLVEGNTWNDRFWGVCKGSGQNWLGRILMEVRDEIRAEQARENE